MPRRLILGLVLAAAGAVVGFGLAAAFPALQTTGAPDTPAGEWVEVLVAKKELVPGTRFTKDALKDQVTRKKFRPGEVPANAISSEDELIERLLVHFLWADDCIRPADLKGYKCLLPPAGLDLITVRLAVDNRTPFIKAGSRIEIIGTGVTRRNQVVGLIVLPDVLLMDEWEDATIPGEWGDRNLTTWVTTLAVTTEEALLLRMCKSAGLQLNYIHRTCGFPLTPSEQEALNRRLKEEAKKFLQDFQHEKNGGPGTDKPPEPQPGKGK